MSRIDELFQRKKERVLSVYCTAGYPFLESTLPVMKALQDAGADMIELGMPYSDPLADGPVIQASSVKALENGMSLPVLFEQIRGFREAISVPVLLMGYMNPVLQYGLERFCADAAAAGVDGLILPDLPMYEYETEYGAVIKKYGLDFVFLVTPETSPERVRLLDGLSSGFLYAVSSSSTTGKDKNFTDQRAYFDRLRGMGLQNPILVGFGIKDKPTFEAACGYTAGAIIGTAYIKALEGTGDIPGTTRQFISSVLS
jgi:tryptophan synthase alpha chain